jgi:hypothetical protein
MVKASNCDFEDYGFNPHLSPDVRIMLFHNPNFEWKFFFKQIDARKKSKSKFLVIVNEELNLESLNAIKNLTYYSSNLIKVRSTSSYTFENRTYNSYFKNRVRAIEKISRFYFLFSSNTRLESAILNVKLRAKYLAQNASIISIGLNFNSNLPTEYINLNASEILTFSEGKDTKLCKFFLISKNPLFIFGTSFKNRFTKSCLLVTHFKKFMPSSIFFLLEENCNSSGFCLMNIKSLSKSDLRNTEVLISVDLKENLFVKSVNLSKIVELFCFNLHIAEVAFGYDVAIPINDNCEIGGTFLNLENRPQKAMQISTNSGSLRSAKNIFTAILEKSIGSSFFLRYIEEFVENIKLFNDLENYFTRIVTKISLNLVTKMDFYPLKALVEDYYTKDVLCKKSLTMLKKSQETRKFFINFL